MWVLEVLSSTETIQYFVRGPVIRLGRIPDNCISFPADKSISRNHAEIHVNSDAAELTIIDLGSSYGTIVNQSKLTKNTPFTLQSGSQVLLGGSGTKIQILKKQLSVCATGLDRTEKEALHRNLRATGGKLVSRAEAATHVISNKYAATLKMLTALVAAPAVRIVTDGWLNSFADFPGSCSRIPPEEDYAPPNVVATQDSSSQPMDVHVVEPYKPRRHLLRDYTVFLVQAADQQYGPILTSCGCTISSIYNEKSSAEQWDAEQIFHWVEHCTSSTALASTLTSSVRTTNAKAAEQPVDSTAHESKFCILFDENSSSIQIDLITHLAELCASQNSSSQKRRELRWLTTGAIATSIMHLMPPESYSSDSFLAWLQRKSNALDRSRPGTQVAGSSQLHSQCLPSQKDFKSNVDTSVPIAATTDCNSFVPPLLSNPSSSVRSASEKVKGVQVRDGEPCDTSIPVTRKRLRAFEEDPDPFSADSAGVAAKMPRLEEMDDGARFAVSDDSPCEDAVGTEAFSTQVVGFGTARSAFSEQRSRRSDLPLVPASSEMEDNAPQKNVHGTETRDTRVPGATRGTGQPVGRVTSSEQIFSGPSNAHRSQQNGNGGERREKRGREEYHDLDQQPSKMSYTAADEPEDEEDGWFVARKAGRVLDSCEPLCNLAAISTARAPSKPSKRLLTKGSKKHLDAASFSDDDHEHNARDEEVTENENRTPATTVEMPNMIRPLVRRPGKRASRSNLPNVKVFKKNRIRIPIVYDFLNVDEMDRVLPKETARDIELRRELEELIRKEKQMDALLHEEEGARKKTQKTLNRA